MLLATALLGLSGCDIAEPEDEDPDQEFLNRIIRTYGEWPSLATAVIQTIDGGYALTGTILLPESGHRVLLVRTDEDGNMSWMGTYPITGWSWIHGHSVQQTSDGGYIFAGLSGGLDAGSHVILTRIDAAGIQSWSKVFFRGRGFMARQTEDGGFVVAGHGLNSPSLFDMWLLRTDENGDTLWTRFYGGDESEEAREVFITEDGGYCLIGVTASFGAWPFDAYLVITDSLGNPVSSHTYGGAGYDYIYAGDQTDDGGYIMAGYSRSFAPELDAQMYLIRVDAEGNLVWERDYGGPRGEVGRSVRQTDDGGYIVAGFTESFGAGYDVWLVRTDADGDTLWTRTYGTANDETGNSVLQTEDGGFVVAGTINGLGLLYPGENDRAFLMITDENGDWIEWSKE